MALIKIACDYVNEGGQDHDCHHQQLLAGSCFLSLPLIPTQHNVALVQLQENRGVKRDTDTAGGNLDMIRTLIVWCTFSCLPPECTMKCFSENSRPLITYV